MEKKGEGEVSVGAYIILVFRVCFKRDLSATSCAPNVESWRVLVSTVYPMFW